MSTSDARFLLHLESWLGWRESQLGNELTFDPAALPRKLLTRLLIRRLFA